MEYAKGEKLNFDKYTHAKPKPPPHEKAASVDAIIELVGQTKTYNYTFWLQKIGRASYATVLGIVKEAGGLESKYSKGGFITNRLKPYATRTKRTRAD